MFNMSHDRLRPFDAQVHVHAVGVLDAISAISSDQGYGDTRSTLAHRTVIQTALSAILNQSTLGRTFTLLYGLTLTLDRSRNGKWK